MALQLLIACSDLPVRCRGQAIRWQQMPAGRAYGATHPLWPLLSTSVSTGMVTPPNAGGG
eukprot:jgi/Chrpa1/10776/Chrysochromulina_OHIO_Genome00018665-RA